LKKKNYILYIKYYFSKKQTNVICALSLTDGFMVNPN